MSTRLTNHPRNVAPPRVPEDPILRQYRRRRIFRPTTALSGAPRVSQSLAPAREPTALTIVNMVRSLATLTRIKTMTPSNIHCKLSEYREDITHVQSTLCALRNFWEKTQNTSMEIRGALRSALNEIRLLREDYEIVTAHNEILREDIMHEADHNKRSRDALRALRGTLPRREDVECSSDDTLACTVCYANSRKVALVPCNHFLCASCAIQILKESRCRCPFCRQPALGWVMHAGELQSSWLCTVRE